MRIEGDLAISMADQLAYTHLAGLYTKVRGKSVPGNHGSRKLKEGRFRLDDIQQVTRYISASPNKYLVLRKLPHGALMKILGMLDKEALLQGLHLFSKAKIMRLMFYLPKETLVRMLLRLFPLSFIISRMSTRELFRILRSPRLKERDLVKGFAEMDTKYLQFILMKVTRQDTSHLRKPEMLSMLLNLRKREILQSMEMLPFKALIPFVYTLAKRDPALLECMSLGYMFKLFDKMGKADLIETFRILPESTLVDFLDSLPNQYLALVAGELGDTQFQAFMVNSFPNLIATMAGLEVA